MSDILAEQDEFDAPVPADQVVVKKLKPGATWYCIHCQEVTPQRTTILYDGMRVCEKPDCVRVAILEDRYSQKYQRPKIETKPCTRCGEDLGKKHKEKV